uniref:Uncharacterized protein n=1 Tax=Nelumbo nucifera TaxID=4432 RepID=A0A822Y1H6_NELNU|nr:TPA_asm: hypothetical protein HUJ06_027301 [Nelumbo nucifera]
MEEAIGAEYGEGFETFRPNGPLKVDVDFLNDRLQEGFLQRIRYAMKPDEAFGLIFSWENVVVITFGPFFFLVGIMFSCLASGGIGFYFCGGS